MYTLVIVLHVTRIINRPISITFVVIFYHQMRSLKRRYNLLIERIEIWTHNFGNTTRLCKSTLS